MVVGRCSPKLSRHKLQDKPFLRPVPQQLLPNLGLLLRKLDPEETS